MQHFIQMLPAPGRSRLQIADAMCAMCAMSAIARSQADVGCQMHQMHQMHPTEDTKGVQSDLLEVEEFRDLFAAKISPFCILSHFSNLSLVNVKPVKAFRWILGARCTADSKNQLMPLTRPFLKVALEIVWIKKSMVFDHFDFPSANFDPLPRHFEDFEWCNELMTGPSSRRRDRSSLSFSPEALRRIVSRLPLSSKKASKPQRRLKRRWSRNPKRYPICPWQSESKQYQHQQYYFCASFRLTVDWQKND